MKCANTTGPRSSPHCISALTICTLEMRDVMVKLLPEVLLNLSKISATIHIAFPVLELLSSKYMLKSKVFCVITEVIFLHLLEKYKLLKGKTL